MTHLHQFQEQGQVQPPGSYARKGGVKTSYGSSSASSYGQVPAFVHPQTHGQMQTFGHSYRQPPPFALSYGQPSARPSFEGKVFCHIFFVSLKVVNRALSSISVQI